MSTLSGTVANVARELSEGRPGARGSRGGPERHMDRGGSPVHDGHNKRAGKRRRSHHRFIETEGARLLRSLDLTGVRTFGLEGLQKVERGKFSRHSNGLQSFWHDAKIGTQLAQRCEVSGISIDFRHPWKTSQRCPECGNIDRRNRNGKRFLSRKGGSQTTWTTWERGTSS